MSSTTVTSLFFVFVCFFYQSIGKIISLLKLLGNITQVSDVDLGPLVKIFFFWRTKLHFIKILRNQMLHKSAIYRTKYGVGHFVHWSFINLYIHVFYTVAYTYATKSTINKNDALFYDCWILFIIAITVRCPIPTYWT